MKKSILFAALSMFIATAFFGLEVDEAEIRSTSTTIEFINYTGPHKVIDSIEAINAIGSGMGSVISKSITSTTSTGNSSKYYVVHAVDDTNGKLDADIIFIGKEATVDHVNNLRRIISAYLSSAYGYSSKDADTLAVFVTVYNAVYRGNKGYFQSKYKDIVLKNLSSNCGLSTNYKDWPGNSEILIPLFDVKNGGLSTVDTSVISDSKVVDSMQDDDDKNIDSRKDMVDLKEREAEDASDKAKEAQKKATTEQNKLDEEKAKTETAKKEAETAKKEAEEKKEIAEKNPTDKTAQKEAAEAEKKAEEKQQAVEKRQEKEAEQAEKTQSAKDEAAEKQAIADKKQTEAQTERKEIAKDQQDIQKKEAAEAKMPSDYGIIISNESALLSRLVKFNKITGEVIKNSPVTVIRSRTIYKGSTNFIAIAGEDGKNSTIKLVTIDPETMEINGESESKIASDSVLVKNDSDYYCVIDNNGKYYVGKFDENLSLKLSSTVTVMNSTPITVTDSGLVVTGSDGKLKLLNLKDLTAVTNPTNKDAK